MTDLLTEKLTRLGTVDKDTRAEHDRWRNDLTALYANARAWLQDAADAGQLRFVDQWTQVREGTVLEDHPQLCIQLEVGPALLLVPRGRDTRGVAIVQEGEIVHARGRVDLVRFHSVQLVAFYRGLDGAWFVPTPNEAEPWAPLTRARFRDAVAALLPAL